MADVETLRVIHIDAAGGVIAVEDFPGNASAVALPLRRVIGDALRLDTRGLILSHNHPGGDPQPSAADRAATSLLARVAAALGIRVHDHLIRGGGRCVSFRQLGLL